MCSADFCISDHLRHTGHPADRTYLLPVWKNLGIDGSRTILWNSAVYPDQCLRNGRSDSAWRPVWISHCGISCQGGTEKSTDDSAVSLLAGIPSVVYGLVGMQVLVPGIRELFHVPDGASLLAAIIVLAIMILPSIIKVSMTSLEAVPKEYEDASLALGATPVETYFRVSVPAAKSGIAAAVVLGVGRAIGEAMAVMMVSGNVPNMPELFQSVRFLTTAVASEMSYSSGLQRQALFSIALVLFLFIMLINATLNFFLKRDKEA